jgi:recombination protein RecA
MSKALDELKSIVDEPKKAVAVVKSAAPQTMAEKWKVLDRLEKSLNEQLKTTTSLVKLGSKVGQLMPSISTGLYTLDFGAIGCGGIPRGRIIELFGPESSGKTTIALHVVGMEQKNGAICAFIDAEHALDPTYAAKLGVDVDNLVVSQPDSGEDALEIAEALVDSQSVSLIVIDSVAALVPQAELDGEMGESHMGLQARLMSQACRKLRGKCAVNGVTIVFINQIREKIGVMFGSPETTTGGRALKFYASVRIDVRKVWKSEIKSGEIILGHSIKLKIVKNKVGPPFREAFATLIYETGIDITSNFLDYAIDIGAIQQNGAWFVVNEEKIQGKDKVKKLFLDDSEAMTNLKVEVARIQKIQREQ